MESILFFIAGIAFGMWYERGRATGSYQWKRALLAAIIAILVAIALTLLMSK